MRTCILLYGYNSFQSIWPGCFNLKNYKEKSDRKVEIFIKILSLD